MTKHLEPQFIGYMTACYGSAWAVRLPPRQLAETKQAFYMGALAYQGLVLKTLNPATDENAGELTAEEEAHGARVFSELADEIETFGHGRIFDLFAAATNGGSRA